MVFTYASTGLLYPYFEVQVRTITGLGPLGGRLGIALALSDRVAGLGCWLEAWDQSYLEGTVRRAGMKDPVILGPYWVGYLEDYTIIERVCVAYAIHMRFRVGYGAGLNLRVHLVRQVVSPYHHIEGPE